MKAIRKVISGGQTGVDRAALEAAKECGIETGGTAPKGYRTEWGNDTTLASFGLIEHWSSDYSYRTVVNIQIADFVLIIGELTGGTKQTAELCLQLGIPRLFVPRNCLASKPWIERTATRIGFEAQKKPIVLNVAGNRESKSPGIAEEAQVFLELVFEYVAKT